LNNFAGIKELFWITVNYCELLELLGFYFRLLGFLLYFTTGLLIFQLGYLIFSTGLCFLCFCRGIFQQAVVNCVNFSCFFMNCMNGRCILWIVLIKFNEMRELLTKFHELREFLAKYQWYAQIFNRFFSFIVEKM
jgi:hypothetical protein